MKFYITTAIPYVNAPPHIGHALEFVQTDVIARYHRIKGDETFLTTGADENALKNVRAAEEVGITTQELVNKNSDLFVEFAKKLGVEVDGFNKGSDQKKHWPGVIELWKRCQINGDIYKKSYQGLYCVGHEAFLTEKELKDGKCPDHGTKPDVVEEENYFFRLSKYQKQLEELIESDKYKITPKTRKNEVLSFIKSGLEDFSISRTKARAKGWGIPVPGDENQVIYVWFDALTVYLTAIGFGVDEEKTKKWWPADIHVIGKDIIRFHAIYWPAMLLSAQLETPKQLFVHGFITSGGQKMSKTLGNVIDPIDYIEKYGAEALRYYLLAEIPSTDDGDFTHEKFLARYNGDLADGLGNLAARITTLTQGKSFSGKADREIGEFISEVWNSYNEAFKDLDLRKAAEAVWSLIHFLDSYIERTKPWESKDEKVLYNLLFGLAHVASLARPILPETPNKIFEGLGVDPNSNEAWDFKPKKIDPLFPKIDK